MKTFALFLILNLLAFAQTYDLSESGWHMLGTTEEISSMDSFNKTCVSSVWRYDTDENSWKFYIPGSAGSTLNQIKKARGFWLKSSAPCMIDPAESASESSSYLMAFHACSGSQCSDGKQHITYLAESNDGTQWSLIEGSEMQGSVPDVVRRGNMLYIYNPGSVRTYDLATGVWSEKQNLTITLSDGSSETFVDPSPILDDSGNIVLFYLPGIIGQDPAQCPTGETSCTKAIHSATEVAGSNGAQFVIDEGNRAEIAVDSNSEFKTASDPDIFSGKDGYVLFVSVGNAIQVHHSTTLKGSYTRSSSLPEGILTSFGGVPSGHYDAASDTYWVYAHANDSSGKSIIRQAKVDSLDATISDSAFQTLIQAPNFSGLESYDSVASPGFTLKE